MYFCTMPVPDSGKRPLVSLKNRTLYDFASIYGNGLGWFGGCLVCFNGPHDSYAYS